MAERQATPTPNADDDPLNHLTIDEIDIRLAEAEAKVARQEKIDRLRILQQQLARPPSCPPIPSVPMVAEAHTRSDAGRLPLPKFDGTPDSFTSWIQTAALWLRNRGYANVIGINEDGSPTATTGTTDDPALEAAAREILLVHMLDHKIASALSLFQAGSAAKCWRVLFQAYSPSSLASVVRAIRDLVTIQHTPGESVATYAARVQAAAHRVRATVPTEMLSLTDALVAVLILANASSDLDAVVAGLHNRALDTLPSVSEVVASLTSEEIRIRDVRDRQESFQTANRSSCNTSTRTRGPRRNESCVFHPGSKHTNGECSLQRHIWHRDNNNNNNSNTSSPTSHEYPSSGALPTDPASEPTRALSARHSIDASASSMGLLDSACSTTMTPLRQHLSRYRRVSGPEVELADLSRTTTSGRGVMSFGKDARAMSIDSLHVPRLGQALVSVGQLTRSGHKIVFDGATATIYSKDSWTAPTGQPVAISTRGQDNLYRIALSAPSTNNTQPTVPACSLIVSDIACRAAKVTAASPDLWHARTGHLGYGNLNILRNRCRGMKFDGPIPKRSDRCPCEACLLVKDDVSTDEDDDDAEDDPDYEDSASSNDSPNEAADPVVHDNAAEADVDPNAIEVPRPRRSSRRRQPPGEWWKAPEAANHDVSTDEDDDDAEDDPDYEDSASGSDSSNEAADPAVLDNAADADVDPNVIDVPRPRRSDRRRQPPGEWWKAPDVEQRIHYDQQHMPAARERRHALRDSVPAGVGNRYTVGDYVATVTSAAHAVRAEPLLAMAERQATPNTDDDPLCHLSLEEIDTRIAEAEATIARQEKIDRLRVLQQQLARPTSCPSTPAMPIIAEAHSRSDAGRLPMPKFDGTPDSFTSWVQTAALWFRNRGYADVIGINEDGSPNATTGTAHDPPLEAAAREILLVHMLDHKIASALSLFQAGSAAKCWRVLFQAYSPSSLASVVRAVRDLVTVQHMSGESVATYAARVQAAAHRVRSTVPTEMLSLTDALVAVLILANASSDFDAVVAGLHNRALDTLPSVSEVVGSLTSEEIRVQDVRDRHDAFQTANRSSCATSTRPRGPRRNESCVFHPGSKHTNGECTLQRHIWYRDSNAKSNTSSPTSNEYPTSGAHPIDPAPEPMRALSARHAIDVYANSVGLLDSACSTTMTPLRRHLSCYRQGTGPEVELADLSRTTTSGRGVTSFGMDVQATSIDSLHVPRLGQALVSVGQLTRSGHKIVFDGDTAKIYSGANWTAPVGQPVAVSQRGHDNLYRIPLSAPTSAPGTLHSARVCSLIASSVSCRVAKVTAAAPAVWHARTGHLGYGNLRILHKRCRGMKFDGPIPRPQDRCPCAACLLAKGNRSSFPPSTSRARRVGDLVHSDLSGRWPVVGVGGFEYYQTMLDDSSRYLSVYLLRRKSEALDVIKHYDARLRNQEGRGIRTFQTDGGGEYNSKACVLFYNESGILHRKS
ncbi:hypothetical protein PBRA_001014, partial [Plasmodiophora brassicae]